MYITADTQQHKSFKRKQNAKILVRNRGNQSLPFSQGFILIFLGDLLKMSKTLKGFIDELKFSYEAEKKLQKVSYLSYRKNPTYKFST